MEGVRQRRRGKDIIHTVGHDSIQSSYNGASLHTKASIAIIIGFLVYLKLILIVNQTLPTHLRVADEIKKPLRFISERAENDLLRLVSLGPRVTGSYECEVLAVRTLRQEIAVIAQTANPIHLIQQDLQRPKGSFYMGLKPHGFQSIYENIQNIAVRLGPKPPSNHSILVNCHFDTVPESPGASDNGLNCAVMLEVLRKMSRLPEPLQHNIIFLFNGAEENVLQAAHGFITKHHWSKEVRVVVNLDAAGAGGREILFQATQDHPWLLRTYARAVPRPSASLAGQELFDSGLIPSDTDYRIFRDFGPVPGIDIAHVDNGYIYHTRQDTMNFISPGVYQHTGDNILSLLQHLSYAPEVADIVAAREPGAKLVYYDVFGLFMLVYSNNFGALINIVAVALSVFAAWNVFFKIYKLEHESVYQLGLACMKALLGVVLGAMTNLVVALVLDRTGMTMSWYARPYYIIPLYVAPYVAAALLPWVRRMNGGIQASLEYFFGGQILTAMLLLLLTLVDIRSAYLLMLLLMFPAIVTIAYLRNRSVSLWKLLCVVLGTSLLGVSMFLHNTFTMFFVLIPITGRSGSTINPEMVIAGLTSLVSFAVGNSLIPLLVTVRRPLAVVRGLLFCHLIALIIVICTPMGFPYSDRPKAPALQRFYSYHTEQVLYDTDGKVLRNSSGVFILPMDRNKMKYVQELVPELKDVVPANCDHGLLCQFPLYNSRYVNPAKTSFWLPMDAPYIQLPTKLNLQEMLKISPRKRRYHFKIKGPDHITLVISPRDGVELTNWTLGIGRHPATYDKRNYYVVYFSDGHVGDVSNFALDFETSEEFGVGEAWFDMSVIGHYLHQKGTYTNQFNALLSHFPAWAHVTSWVASVHGVSF